MCETVGEAMVNESNNRNVRIVPHGLRDSFRQQQIDAIKAEVKRDFAGRIRAAATKEQKRALKAERDAEIARRIAPLIRDRELDTPECL
jgi:hypothetical protein